MKLYISKLLSTALPIVGVLCIFGFAFAGNISMGWILFVVLALISGIIKHHILQMSALRQINTGKLYGQPEVLSSVWRGSRYEAFKNKLLRKMPQE